MPSLALWFEPTTNVINIGLVLVTLFLGARILKTVRFSLLRSSVQMFIAAALLFAAKEIFSSLEWGAGLFWVNEISQGLETVFIACLCCAMYLIVQFERLEMSSLHDRVSKDSLTGLLNYSAFSQIAELRIKHAHDNDIPLTLFMLDMDGFKQYNDSFGHEAGNVALQAVAATLYRAARENDLVARYGGEEFVLLLSCHPEFAAAAAERFRKVIESECSPHSNSALQRQLTASIGVACLALAGHTLNELIEVADRQLYQAKREGRNQVSLAA